MNNRPHAQLMLMLLLAAPGATRSESTASAAGPRIWYLSTIASDEIYDALKTNSMFATLDKENAGNPVIIRVTHTYGRPGIAAGLASAILAGATLGILPAVQNRDLVVSYEVIVHGTTISTYSYSKNITRVFNIHATDKTHGLGADGLAWVTGTARQFTDALAHDPRYAAVQSEYHYYFDQAATAAR